MKLLQMNKHERKQDERLNIEEVDGIKPRNGNVTERRYHKLCQILHSGGEFFRVEGKRQQSVCLAEIAGPCVFVLYLHGEVRREPTPLQVT